MEAQRARKMTQNRQPRLGVTVAWDTFSFCAGFAAFSGVLDIDGRSDGRERAGGSEAGGSEERPGWRRLAWRRSFCRRAYRLRVALRTTCMRRSRSTQNVPRRTFWARAHDGRREFSAAFRVVTASSDNNLRRHEGHPKIALSTSHFDAISNCGYFTLK